MYILLLLPIIQAWTAAAAARRNRDIMSRHFSGWLSLRRRVTALRPLARRAAARQRRLALARAFRTISLSNHRSAAEAVTLGAQFSRPRAGDSEKSGGGCSGTGTRDIPLEGISATQAVEEALRYKAGLEARVGMLRAQLAHERARALERRAEVGRVDEEASDSWVQDARTCL